MRTKVFSMLTAVLTLMSCLLGVVPISAGAAEAVQLQLYVSPNGSDTGSGSAESPFATVQRAQEEVRKHNQNMSGNIIVNIAGGRYELEDELRFWPEDSGTNGYDVIYRGNRDELPTLSGGRRVTGWTESEDGVWTTKVEDADFILDLFVNETPAEVASSEKKIFALDHYRVEGSRYETDGMIIEKSKLGLYKNPQDIMFHWPTTWKDFRIHVEDIIEDPANPNNVIALMSNPMWDACRGLAGYGIIPQPDIGFEVENAYELMDEPGEFYFDKSTKVLSYIPREGDDINTAVVIRAELDRILRVEGRDYRHQVSNIRFEDLRFAHCTYSEMDETNVSNQQGEVPVVPAPKGGTTPGSVEVGYAHNIDFSSCVFFGMNRACLVFEEAVRDSEVVGNVFSDLGSSAFILGRYYALNFVEPPAEAEKKAANVMFRKGWMDSARHTNQYAGATVFINPSKSDEYAPDTVNPIWRNEPDAAEEGILSWVRADLDDPFSIDSIRVSFETNQEGETVSEAERSNFEILVSNDKKFENYKVIERFDGVAPEVVTTKGTDGEKYRYVMLRKTTPGPFAITGLKVFSYDREPLPKSADVVDNITFDNNYIARTATIHMQAPAVIAHVPRNSSLSHNEIHETSYTGMSIGWAFSGFGYKWLGNNKINYNRIDQCMLQTDDGGGIYMMDYQPNTEYVGNYISNVNNLVDGFYFEEGSYWMEVRDSVVLNAPYCMFFWYAGSRSIKDAIKVRNTWSDTTDVSRTPGDDFMDLEQVQQYSNGNKPDKVVEIMANAGIEDEYAYILDRVPDGDFPVLEGPDSYEAYQRVASGNATKRGERYAATAERLVQYGDFGVLPWQYDLNYRYELADLAGRMKSGKNKADDRASGHILEQTMLKYAIEGTYASEEHLTVEEMVELCSKELAETKTEKRIGGCSPEVLQTFSKAFDAAKGMPESTKVERAMKVHRLEQAYTAFYKEKYNADILYCYIPDGETEIDAENKVVTVKLAMNQEIGEVLPEFTVSENAVIAADLSKIDFSKSEYEIPVCNTKIQEYSRWKLKIERGEAPVAERRVSAKSADWVNNNPNTKLPERGDMLTLQPWFDTYMTKAQYDGKISFETRLSAPDVDKGVHYLFSAQAEQIEYDGLYPKNTYYELVLKGEDAYLQRVDAGVTTEICVAKKAGFLYGDKNAIEIDIREDKCADNIKIDLNGQTIIHTLVRNPIGTKGHFGVLSRNQKVELFQ